MKSGRPVLHRGSEDCEGDWGMDESEGSEFHSLICRLQTSQLAGRDLNSFPATMAARTSKVTYCQSGYRRLTVTVVCLSRLWLDQSEERPVFFWGLWRVMTFILGEMIPLYYLKKKSAQMSTGSKRVNNFRWNFLEGGGGGVGGAFVVIWEESQLC